MSLKMIFFQKFHLNTSLFLFLLLLASQTSNAQCAGADATITICNIQDPSNQTIDLFALLGAGAQPGGIWTSSIPTIGFNAATGILNAWNVKQRGIYVFTYTVNDPLCADNSSTVTVTIGGYAGVPSPGIACDDDNGVNLFQFFDPASPSPQFGGVWADIDNTGALSGNFLDATQTGLGTFSFKYTIPAIGSCPISEIIVSVKVYPAPVPGVGQSLFFCENDDFSTYTNVNLLDYLSGQDPNGDWTESGGTSELSSVNDTFINIQNIFNTSGTGEYSFIYTVYPNSPICIPKTATVFLKIAPIIDLTGGSLVINSDICEDKIGTVPFMAVLTQGIKPIADGLYSVNYSISGPAPTYNGVASVAFVNGITNFNLPPSEFSEDGTFTVTITGIKLLTDPSTCGSITGISGTVNVFPLPNLDNAVIDIDQICLNSNGVVEIIGIGNLMPGDYQITYSIVGQNQILGQVGTFTVTAGTAVLTIPYTVLQNIGTSTLLITKIVNLTTGCEKAVNIIKSFEVRPLPNLSNLAISVSNVCQSNSATVNVTGLGSMTNVSIIYNLSGANTSVAQTISLTAVAGSGSFTIPGNLLPNFGSTNVNITIVIDSATSCSSPANTIATFNVNPLPDAANVSVVINDVCQNQPVNVLLSGLDNTSTISIAYTLSGANTSTQTTVIAPSSGSGTFVIPANLLVNNGTTLFTITAIGNSATNCPAPLNIQDSFTINPLPNVTGFGVNIPSVCQNQPVSVLFSNLGAATSLTISYNLSGANTVVNQTATINVVAGSAVYLIPSSLLPNLGATMMSVTNVSDPITNCSVPSSIVRNFTINPLPNPVTISVVIPDACKNQTVSALLSGLGVITSATITYDLSGANNVTSQTAVVTVLGGSAVYVIPATLLPNIGDTTFTITNLTYTQSNCSVPVTSVSDVFKIIDLPASPIVSDMSFCKAQNATVADLIPNGAQFNWFISATATTPLSADTLLVSGNYYVSEINAATNCGSLRTMVTVDIVQLVPPVLNADGEKFCGTKNPTLLDLTNNTTAGADVIWYDAPQNGTVLPNSQILEEGSIYYGFQSSNSISCISETGLAVTVILTDCDDDDDDDFFIPDGFSPNNDTVNDTFKIPDIEFLYPDFTIEIYNRYGSLVFKGNKFKPAWDGRNSQSGNSIDGIAPNGVYFYVINFNKNNKSPKQGRLYLNR